MFQVIETTSGWLYKTVKGKELEEHCVRGWELVGLVSEQEAQTVSASVPVISENNYSGQQTRHVTTHQVQFSVPTQETAYLMRHNPGSTLAQQTAKIDELTQANKAADDALKAEKTKCSEAELALKRAKLALDSQTTHADDLFQSKLTLEKLNKKMECDIGKLRTHFGAKQVKEALEG